MHASQQVSTRRAETDEMNKANWQNTLWVLTSTRSRGYLAKFWPRPAKNSPLTSAISRPQGKRPVKKHCPGERARALGKARGENEWLAEFAATYGLACEAEFWRTSERAVKENGTG
jgi:hypothetical protein